MERKVSKAWWTNMFQFLEYFTIKKPEPTRLTDVSETQITM